MENTENAEFIDITEQNIDDEHLCCIIRSKKPHPGIEAKREWLRGRLKDGHVFRKLCVKAPVFIEYAPVEKAWTPVEGDGFYYIYCLWADGAYKGKGYGKALLEHCIADVKAKGGSGVCLLGAAKQKGWLTDQSFAKRFGFKAADATENGYELLALSFDGSAPRFTASAKRMEIESQDLTIYYDAQCPYIFQWLEALREYCGANGVPADFIQVDTLEKAKALPCVFNNWAVFYKGKFQTVNLLDVASLERLLKK